jgi:hypothetical protein
MLTTLRTRRFRDGRGKDYYVDCEESNGLLSLSFPDFPEWTILREENPDGTYNVIALTEEMVHGYDETPPTGYCAYENMALEDWRKLVRGFMKGSFEETLNQELKKVKDAVWELIDKIDNYDYPPLDPRLKIISPLSWVTN